ncbi:MAG: hypothetical protein ABF991_00545 [Liquorilactobacillus hordei]|uniref:hypothetical protein n=1 Tax=Liquorilactobacillus hordei TaxID=468911 RepID=UPI0039E8C4D9
MHKRARNHKWLVFIARGNNRFGKEYQPKTRRKWKNDYKNWSHHYEPQGKRLS